MDFEADEGPNAGFMHLKVSGEYKRPEDSFVLEEFMVEALRTKGINRILLDFYHAEIEGGMSGAYSIGAGPRKPGVFPQDFKLAAVYKVIHADTLFLESSLRECGFFFKVFTNTQDALAWLETDTVRQESIRRARVGAERRQRLKRS